MRYHTTPPDIKTNRHGCIYYCDHPVYDRCTLFTEENRGLAVICQHFDEVNKHTVWAEIEPWLADLIYEHNNFKSYFDERSGPADKNGLYPTVTVRQIMWGLKIKPLKKMRWETVFDRKCI